jgi:hypothetical protein
MTFCNFISMSLRENTVFIQNSNKGRKDWTGPKGSRRLRLPDCKITAHKSGKFVSPTHRPPLPQEIFLVLISVRG